MTALDKSFTLMVSLPVIFCSTLTSLLFSRVGNPFLTLWDITDKNTAWCNLDSNSIPNKSSAFQVLYLIVLVMQLFETTLCSLNSENTKAILQLLVQH